jgi:hypothetical protein
MRKKVGTLASSLGRTNGPEQGSRTILKKTITSGTTPACNPAVFWLAGMMRYIYARLG